MKSILTFKSRSRSSHQRYSIKKGVLRNFSKFIAKHLCQSLFFDKVAGLRPAALLKKRLWHKFFRHTGIPGLWTLNSRRWILDSGLWTLDTVVDCWRTESEPSLWFCLIKWLKILWVRISKDHGHACSVETIGSEVAIFRNSILTLSITL